jgi:ADP-ribosylation factor-like protein 2
MKQVCGEDVHEISPTVGFNIKSLDYNGYTLNLWDVGGQKVLFSAFEMFSTAYKGIVIEYTDVLEELLRTDRWNHMGR